MFDNGASWLRIDLHLHTEKDREFKYDGKSFYDDYIGELKEKNIQVGAITNHNKFNRFEFKNLKKRAIKEGIHLLPGVELSIKEGQNGIHTLIIFDESEWLKNDTDDINNFLNQVFTGIENRESENVRCKEDIFGVIETLEEFNKDFFIIFAHIEQKSGFYNELNGGIISDISKKPSFKKHVYGFQKVRTRDYKQNLKSWMKYEIAAVEGSDPKSIDEIGKGKPCFIKLGSFNFDAIKLALRDFHSRITMEIPNINHAYIKSIEFVGGKLNNKKIHLASELNTLIGIRGSGKSSILESLRYGLNISSLVDQDYKNSLIENTLSSGGYLKINLIDHHGDKYSIKRILNESPTIYNEHGELLQISTSSIINNPLYFGQKDLSQTGIGYELDLLNKLLGDNLTDINKKIVANNTNVANAIREWLSIGNLTSEIESLETANEDLNHKIKYFEDKGVAEKLKKQTTLNSELLKIDSLDKSITDLENKLITALSSVDMDELNNFEQYSSPYNDSVIISFRETVLELKSFLSSTKSKVNELQNISKKNKSILQSLTDVKNTLQDEFAEIRREINHPNLKAEDYISFTSTKNKNIEKIKKLKLKQNNKGELQRKLLELLDSRNTILLSELKIYEHEIAKINAQQEELEISIEFKGDKDSFKSILVNCFKGSGISNLKYSQIASQYTDMASLFVDTMINNGIKLNAIVTPNEFSKVVKVFEENFDDIVSIKTPNLIKIGYHGKDLSKHSLGQRSSALVLFILTQEDNDLIIIDQPEDDLDNQVIYQELIKTIKEKKRNIQFIFATHNPNIPVLGDSEQVIYTNYTDEEIFYGSGSIDDLDTRTKIVDIMEGGTEAFGRRNQIYKLWEKNS